jgi:N-sulfoglucosamine sulfohydrolase
MTPLRIASFILLAATTGSSLHAAPRNVVLMIGDDHGLQVGCYGDKVIKTPSMDSLATQGTRFANAFAAVSSCSPSRSVVLTGMFNHTNGMYGLAHEKHNFHSFRNIPSLPQSLKKAGYRTAIVGKYHLQPETVYPFDDTLPCPGGPRNVAAVAESARNFMKTAGEKPFFLLVGYTDPHRDFANKAQYSGIETITYDPADIVVPPWLPDRPETREDLADYYQSISRLDQGIGLMLKAIADTGHEKDTLVIYLSDNGPPWPGAKTTQYEPGIHLPLIIRNPQQVKPGITSQAMVSWVDITPTILDWAGVKAPPKVFGRSLMPILDQENPAGWDTVYGSHTFHEVTMYYPMRTIRTRQYKYILNIACDLEFPFASDLWGSLTWQTVLKQGDKQYGQRTMDAYIHRPREELYDLQADPGETRNLAGDPSRADLVADMRARLLQWQEKTDDPWLIKYKHE